MWSNRLTLLEDVDGCEYVWIRVDPDRIWHLNYGAAKSTNHWLETISLSHFVPPDPTWIEDYRIGTCNPNGEAIVTRILAQETVEAFLLQERL